MKRYNHSPLIQGGSSLNYGKQKGVAEIFRNVVFRVDSSTVIGVGHVMRCLTLAHALKNLGWNISFVCRKFEGNLIDYIQKQGFYVKELPQQPFAIAADTSHPYAQWLGVGWKEDAEATIAYLKELKAKVDWLIVDHYAIDHNWESAVRSYATRIFVIDDLANRFHDCDLLLDQNLVPEMNTRYVPLVSKRTRVLIGPQYALLRPEFRAIRDQSSHEKHNGSTNRQSILIFLGGSDPTNETLKAIKATELAGLPNVLIDVVIGSSNPHRDTLESYCLHLSNVTLYIQTPNMPQLLSKACLIIGAGGINTWERCCLGKPTIILTIAENQVSIAKEIHRYGAAMYLGNAQDVQMEFLSGVITELFNDKRRLALMSQSASSLVDGKGVEKVVFELYGKN
ncbi:MULTISPECIES: UDP-2,4-diacetamido-2,4,6-trideoxy-beta-L-altropyranose hydrolase [Brevibacillus]|uniref:UDP-2,4-diacetamido-2,4, 6-trideoxy-beta-L-altropyranose hydrolase n=1 Tax=Brevibacillus TaxID=55080 RepID=UPI000271C3B8|nr:MULTISPECIES: UDP-2,4-diacetamido-2,4,6-trideoxy-beta-L-altropyranose hydrolase [Brevibacillus]EJL46882.1 pseudaminic acid biosynthesis-associated protein PseG [Brevibacillus sp. CF112]MED1822662.1 UDP-2,4-diacetamido-2,4,6-trideoxy-beta-L-altropyranose hydrolase [Brevibacillus agri]